MRKINIALIFILIVIFMAQDISYAIRLPLNAWQASMNSKKPEFAYYTRDENGDLLKEPCGFPGRWMVEVKVPIKDDTNAGVQRMVKSFSLSMQAQGREDIRKAKFTVVSRLPEEEKDILAREKDFYAARSGKFSIEIVIKASFLKKGISAQRDIFSGIAVKLPRQTELIMPRALKTARNIKKVLIINALSDENSGHGNFQRLNATSLALASLLKKAGYDVKMLTISDIYDAEALKEDLKDIDLVCLSAYDQRISDVKRFSNSLKKANHDIRIAVGGPAVTITPEHVFSYLPDVDIFYRGEAEAGFVEALNSLEDFNFESTLSIPGIAVRRDNMYYFDDFMSINRMAIAQLNTRPFDFSFLNENNIGGAFSLMTSLGCPNACIFCATGGGKAHRAMSPENVISVARGYERRLEELQAQGAVIHPDAWKIVFSDDDFLRGPERAVRIFELWKKAKLKLKIATFQSTLQSFLTKNPNERRAVNAELIRNIAYYRDTIFSHDFMVQIGTDALINPELRRLNKGPYNEKLIEDVMAELNNRDIRNLHDLILTNADTTLGDLTRTLIKGAIFEIKYPCTSFRANYAIIPHTATSAVNKLVEESRESLINDRWIWEGDRIKGFKEYEFHGPLCVIIPGDIPPDIFEKIEGYFAGLSFFNMHTRCVIFQCLSSLSRELGMRADLLSRYTSGDNDMLIKELREFAMLGDDVPSFLEDRYLAVSMDLHFLHMRLTVHLSHSESVEYSL